METITCSRCGTENSSSARNCKQCKNNLQFALEHPEAIEHLKKIESPEPATTTNETFKQCDKGMAAAIGIGLLVGFIGTPFLVNLIMGISISFYLFIGTIGGVFGITGSVTGYTKTKSTRGAWIGAIIGAMIIPSLCYFGFSTHILAF